MIRNAKERAKGPKGQRVKVPNGEEAVLFRNEKERAKGPKGQRAKGPN